MTKQTIFLGQTANDRTGDPLRVAFEKVNENFDELYARTGDDLQIPALSGNDGKVLTTNGTTLSWGFSNQLTSGSRTVTLDTNGIVTFPGGLTIAESVMVYTNGALQRDTGAINCQGNASTVVFTATGVSVHTIRLLIQVEGIEGIGSIMDTQACEMIVAKSFRADDIAASVYGIVYTSVAPLATFTALWNGLTSRIEVLCTTPGANNVNVKIFSTEITTSD